jgi:uncharacterized protein with LGFP repeats
MKTNFSVSKVFLLSGKTMLALTLLLFLWPTIVRAYKEAVVSGQIGVVWKQLGGMEFFGRPITEELDTPTSRFGTYGKYRKFEKGQIIYWHANGPRAGQAFAIWGEILAKYLSMGGVESYYGFPTSHEYEFEGERRTDFEGGYFLWNPDDGVREFVTPIR